MASRWSDIFEREPEREPELGPSHEPGPQPEAEFQEVIEVEEEDEPAPKRKKKTSVAAREWEHKFALLEAFRRRDGHADVPPGYKVGGTKLRAWLDNQRERWQAREWSETLSPFRLVSAGSKASKCPFSGLVPAWVRRPVECGGVHTSILSLVGSVPVRDALPCDPPRSCRCAAPGDAPR